MPKVDRDGTAKPKCSTNLYVKNFPAKSDASKFTEPDLENLFKPFYRASDVKNREMNPQSHGIGLSVCKKIANSLGGDLLLNPDTAVGC